MLFGDVSIGFKYLKSCHMGKEGRFVLSCFRAELELSWMQILLLWNKTVPQLLLARKARVAHEVSLPSLPRNPTLTPHSFVKKTLTRPRKQLSGSHVSWQRGICVQNVCRYVGDVGRGQCVPHIFHSPHW